MNQHPEQHADNGGAAKPMEHPASRDGLASLAIILLTVALIIFVVTSLI